jgi:uncharacterized membrane protein
MENNGYSETRFIEIDILRGFAIILMIFLHILWDLDYFGIMSLNKNIYQLQFITAALFFLVVGICLSFSFKSDKKKNEIKKHLIKRGLLIFSIGLILTAITMFFFPSRPIIFGVLHFIGLSLILSIPFLKFKKYNLPIGIFIIITGIIIGRYPVENPNILLYIIGFHPANVWQSTIDYFPLFPWFGVTLSGVALGNIFYKDNKRRFRMPSLFRYKPMSLFSWLGKHSLKIYLLHQPLIAGTIFVVNNYLYSI